MSILTSLAVGLSVLLSVGVAFAEDKENDLVLLTKDVVGRALLTAKDATKATPKDLEVGRAGDRVHAAKRVVGSANSIAKTAVESMTYVTQASNTDDVAGTVQAAKEVVEIAIPAIEKTPLKSTIDEPEVRDVAVDDTADAEETDDWLEPVPFWGYVGGELGVGQMDSDFLMIVRPAFGGAFDVPQPICSTEECRTGLYFDFSLPLRFVTIDTEPVVKGQVLRNEEWDRVDDYFRVINHIAYGTEDEPFYTALGNLNLVTLGHGTIVKNYSNNISPDTYSLGFQLDIHSKPVGGTFILDNFFDPSLAALNIYFRPFAFDQITSGLDRISVGFTMAASISTPQTLEVKNN